jgi:hypothetical protein
LQCKLILLSLTQPAEIDYSLRAIVGPCRRPGGWSRKKRTTNEGGQNKKIGSAHSDFLLVDSPPALSRSEPLVFLGDGHQARALALLIKALAMASPISR